MTKEEANKLLDHYFSDLSKKEKNRILRFAATYHKELRIENQHLKELLDFNQKQYQQAIDSLSEEIDILRKELDEQDS